MAKQFERSYEASPREVYEAARRCVKDLRHRIKSDDEAELVLKFAVRMSMRSWGERMTLRVVPDGDGSKVVLQGKGVLPQLTDWGAKSKIAEALLAAIDRAVAR